MNNKIEFKHVFKIAITLMLVAGIAGALIVFLNLFTAPIIEENNAKKEQTKLQEIYPNETFETLDYTDSTIKKVSKTTKGYVYQVEGKNAYGNIVLLVGINLDGTVEKVVFLENGESFAQTVNDHVDATYQNKTINQETIDSVDTKCGATYGAKLVKELVSYALNDFIE